MEDSTFESAAVARLQELGYVVTVEVLEDALDNGRWWARRSDRAVAGSRPLELLGLHEILEARGEHWWLREHEHDAYDDLMDTEDWVPTCSS